MPHTFTSLRHSVEKLLEAEYFLGRLTEAKNDEFQYELNAFLSSSRSVTFVLQSSMNEVPRFKEWYGKCQEVMKSDPAMRFFVDLRNVSQKQGPVSYVGGSLLGGGWTYRFVAHRKKLPDEIIGKDIGACCAAHLIKIGHLLLDCMKTFPFYSCPVHAFSEEGMLAIGYDWRDVEMALGLPAGYTDVPTVPPAERLRILRKELEPLDSDSIERIASGQLMRNDCELLFPDTNGFDTIDDVSIQLSEPKPEGLNFRDAFMAAILKNIQKNMRD